LTTERAVLAVVAAMSPVPADWVKEPCMATARSVDPTGKAEAEGITAV